MVSRASPSTVAASPNFVRELATVQRWPGTGSNQRFKSSACGRNWAGSKSSKQTVRASGTSPAASNAVCHGGGIGGGFGAAGGGAGAGDAAGAGLASAAGGSGDAATPVFAGGWSPGG
jgi:hypothetical protein